MSTPNIDAIRRKVDTQDRQRNKPRTVSHQTKDSSGGKWIVGIIVIVALAVFISESNNEGDSSNRSSSSPKNSTVHVTPSTRGMSVEQNKKGNSSRADSSSTGRVNDNKWQIIKYSEESKIPKSIEFTKPPVGTNNSLSVDQIRWCLREQFRFAAQRSYLNTKYKVGAFNSRIADYNQRCLRSSSSPGSLKVAIRDVFKMSSQIVLGTQRSTSSHAERRKLLVTEIQILLQYLGYNPGVVDGLFGKNTKRAIKAFELKSGVKDSHGNVTEYIRGRLMDSTSNLY
jgi:hypothetical protein